MQASASSPQRRRASLCSAPPVEVLESRLLLTLTAYPAESSAPLLNPGKGWVVYQAFANASPAAWAKASVGYTRFSWRDIETADNTYNWALIDSQLNDCISRGKKFAFGVMPCYVNSPTDYVSMPNWVISAGCQYYPASTAPACKVPVWSDGVFITKMGQFVTALKSRYNGNPNIAYIDARTFGNWGEWHLYLLGGTDPGDAVKKQYIDQWAGFDKTQVIVPISGSTGMYAGGYGYYARDTYGFGYREDSSEQPARYNTCAPGLNVAPAVAEWSTNYATLKPLWTDAMVSGGIDGSKYSYMNLAQWNGTEADTFLADKGSLIDQYLNKMGYWFKLAQVDFPDDLGNGSAGSISFKARNDGVAPIYVNWNRSTAPVTYVRLALLDSSNNVLARTGALTGINPFNWKPGQTITNTAGFSFASTANATRLAIGVFSSTSLSNPDIQFAVTGSLANGWYPLPNPSAPTLLGATPASNTQINLTWTDNSDNETGFKIERASDSLFTQNLTLVTTTAANVTSYRDTGLSAGTTYYYRVRATSALGDSANSNAAHTATLATVTVVSLVINDGSAQRSMVDDLTITFSEDVSTLPGAFAVVRRDGTSAAAVASAALDGRTYRLTFSGTGIVGGSLADGAYRVRVNASGVQALSGSTMAGDYTSSRFRRLFGDFNGNGQVDAADLALFRQAQNNVMGYLWYMDYEDDSAINGADYVQLRRRLVRPLL